MKLLKHSKLPPGHACDHHLELESKEQRPRAIFRALKTCFKIDGKSFKTCDQVRGKRSAVHPFFVAMPLPRRTPSKDLTPLVWLDRESDRQIDRQTYTSIPSLFRMFMLLI